MPDSSEVDAALVAVLQGDATLMGYLPDGVYIDEAPPNSTRFVIVSLVDEIDTPQFEGRAFEDALYLVKGVALSTSGANIKAAAARIDALLEQATLAPTGYAALATVRRESRVRITEVDEVDAAIRWQHRGGRYRVIAGG